MTEAKDDAQTLGLPADLIADLEQEEPGFPVWPQNMAIIDAFQAVSNQWHVVSLQSGRVYWQGLDYARVTAGLERAAIVLSPSQWRWLQVMERAAAKVLNGYRG